MTGSSYHKFIGQNLANTQTLFSAANVTVIDILGKLVVVTDAPALYEAAVPNKANVLSLTSGGITISNASDLITNITTTNGNERIDTTFQADYTFGVGIKGFAWDTANGGKSPTDVELGTGSNWDRYVTSIKDCAGTLLIADADQ
jgi:hypothetical protein